MPSGASSRSRIAVSKPTPVTTSTSRPASQYPGLQYPQYAPSGAYCVSCG